MEKDRFNYLVIHFNSLSQQETAELRSEQDRFGYCQVLHNLIARGDQDHQSEMQQHSLHVAAVYSTDRAVLKHIMTEPRTDRTKETPVSSTTENKLQGHTYSTPAKNELTIEVQGQPAVNSVIKEEPKISYTPAPSISDFDQEAAVSRFVAELAPMRVNKLKFEKAWEEFEKTKMDVPIVEKAKRKTAAETAGHTNELLIQHIKSSKKKIASESPKQKEQIEIIDQFIKTKPTISKPTMGVQPELDLTDTTEIYNENVVSETLALILIKQGKKDKAIEVLRKLIWKFPQKKAYFAAQIDELTT